MTKLKKQVHQYDIETGDYIGSYNGVRDAALVIEGDSSHISKAARGIRPTAGGYRWSYHKTDNFIELDEVNMFAIERGINPREITKAKITNNTNGIDRISIETKRLPNLTEEELSVESFQKKAKQLQRKQDENRVINKHFREYSRVENTLTALNEEMNKLLTQDAFKPVVYQHPDRTGAVLIVQVTDLHLNELVELPDNEYGFKVGARRLQKFAHKVRTMAEAFGATEIVIAITGDLINSDRRLDEMMVAATNRTKASLITTRLLYHFIQDINRAGNVKIVSVSGNESRIKDEWGLSEMTMSDNYDFLIYNMLKLLFKDAKGVEFIDGDPVEQVINVNNSNILITHGTTIREGQAAMQQVFGKYAAKGIILDYAIFGHVHFTNITDIYSRSGSLVGNSLYSDRHLNLITKASQVIHVIEPDGTIDNIKVGLQYADAYEGYDIEDDLEAYNPRFADNMKQRTTIVKVVI